MKISKEYLKQVINEELEAEMKGYEMAGESQDLEEAMSPAAKLLAAAGLSFMALVAHRIATAPSQEVAMQQKILRQYSEYDEETMKKALDMAEAKADSHEAWMSMSKQDRAALIDDALRTMQSADAQARIQQTKDALKKRTMNTRKSVVHK